MIKLKEGDRVRVKPGATYWMKTRGYWLDSMPLNIDGMMGVLTGDYTSLPDDSSHWAVDLRLGYEVGVNPQFLELVL